jgi:WD40 repeat protein
MIGNENRTGRAELCRPLLKRGTAFGLDGKTLATGGCAQLSKTETDCAAGAVRLWSVATGELIREINAHDRDVTSVWFAPDGASLLSCGGHGILDWSTQTGEELGALNGECDSSLNPDGKLIALHRWRMRIDLVPASSKDTTPVCEFDYDSGVFSPNGEWFATAKEPDNKDATIIILRSVRTCAILHQLETHDYAIHDLAFSPDSRILITTSPDSTIRFWNPEAGDLLLTITVFKDGAWVTTDTLGRFDCSGCATGDENGEKKYIR